ncbi:hypothetical protein QTP70_027972, partial [Hemibagrus guttatus]
VPEEKAQLSTPILNNFYKCAEESVLMMGIISWCCSWSAQDKSLNSAHNPTTHLLHTNGRSQHERPILCIANQEEPMEAESETLAAMADSLKVSDTRGNPDGQGARKQDEDCFYDCVETFHAETTSLALNQTEMTHSEGTVNELQRESIRNPDTGEESVQAANPFEGSAATRRLEPPEDDTLSGEEDEKTTDSDSEFKEEAAKLTEYDDEYLQEAEKNLTEEEKESRKVESMALKEKGNAHFKNREYVEAQKLYTDALAVCPVCYSKERSFLFSNRAAARIHLEEKTDAIKDCTKAIELNPDYVRAILRRAELYEQTEKLDEALEDYKTVLEKDPGIPVAREACCRLPRQIEERNEKLKEEMLALTRRGMDSARSLKVCCGIWHQDVSSRSFKSCKLKDLGNMILRPFGLSTANFQVNQDDNTGSYSVNFVQNPSSNNR